MDVRVLGGRARHLAGAMCRLAVQSVLAGPSSNISALARAPASAATSRSISRARRRSAAASCQEDGRLACFEAVPESPHSEAGQIVDVGHGEPCGGGTAR